MPDTLRTLIDSIGVRLPDREVTTDEIVAGCANELRVPLERLTGIKTRRRAGGDEFAIDLAEKAARDCLSRSSFAPHEVDAILCTNISRWDAANQVYFEPPTSVRLKHRLGLSRALALDISNACAGMWTGVFLGDALIRTGEYRCVLVVSGEYITHLIDTAQKEIVDFLDSQLASLTLGDAGVAVALTGAEGGSAGFADLELYTLSKFARFCIAKPTDQKHGGAAMYTDGIKVTEAVVPHAAKHFFQVLERNQWPVEQVRHIIPHQTSELTMKAGLREIQRVFSHDFSDRLVNILPHRGNTSSNSHFLALHDSIRSDRVQSGDSLAFCISGSGQTSGTALYVCDDLPDRLRLGRPRERTAVASGSMLLPITVEIESLGLSLSEEPEKADSVQLLAAAARNCLAQSAHGKPEIDVFIAACTYRTDFVMEPAIAALVAGELELNHDREPGDAPKTFAFDLANGELGFLKGAFLAGELIRAGKARQVLLAASEIENNISIRPDDLLGVLPMAAAAVLRESADGEAGFLGFLFRDASEHHAARRTYASWDAQGRVSLCRQDSPGLHELYMEHLPPVVEELLARHELRPDEIDAVILPHVSPDFPQRLAERLGFPAARVIAPGPGPGDPMSATIPTALAFGRRQGRLQPGHIALMASVAPGLQMGCALYRC